MLKIYNSANFFVVVRFYFVILQRKTREVLSDYQLILNDKGFQNTF